MAVVKPSTQRVLKRARPIGTLGFPDAEWVPHEYCHISLVDVDRREMYRARAEKTKIMYTGLLYEYCNRHINRRPL